jgi:hypothetical protein
MNKPNPSGCAPTRAPAAEIARNWKRPFLAALAETSNVARAARIAEVSPSTVYDARRKSRDFARQWQASLCEGYDNLEMELLARLREGEIKRAAGAKTGVRTFDNATAWRMLMAHREARAKEHAGRANVTAAEVRASIERKVAALRAQVEARDTGTEADDGSAG